MTGPPRASVIVAHPRPGSLNHALAHAAAGGLRSSGFDVRLHDLYAEGFRPALQADEMESTLFDDDLAARHAAEIVLAHRVVVVHPSWFFQVPAILKGWVDRVLREGIAFKREEDGAITGLLRAERALVVTTANAPWVYEEGVLGDPLGTFWERCVFGPAGVERVERLVLTPVRDSSSEQREAWLRRVSQVAGERERPGLT